MDLTAILAAAETAAPEKSEVPFFVAGGLLATFAVAISVFGFKRPDFPATAAAARGVMTASVLLVLVAVSTAVYVAL
jgi:hypothetical protein